ncbi:MAG TPA: restriction endonuclease subunit S [Ignavibacteriales bacterium]|nr:restriction endonuclease subunit S [Ignavibacteriales bacterium]
MTEWKEYKLGDLLQVNQKSIAKDFPFTKIEYLDTGSITLGKIDGFQIFNLADAPSRAKRLLTNNDIIYSTVRPIQRHYGIIKNPNPNIVVSTGFAVLSCDVHVTDPYFIYYFLTQDDVVNYLDSVAEGSTSAYPSLTPDVITDIDILLPELPEQRTIASILSSLDDKIDLLHRQNKTLEALAETLFRQWFIEEAEESWEECSLFDAMEIVGGGTPKTEIIEYWNREINWMSGKDISSNHKQFILSTEKKITEEGLKNSSAKVLPKYASVVSARGTVGKICLLSIPMAFSQTNYGILPRIKESFFFTYLLLSYSIEELQSASYGSVFDTITTNTFKEHKISIPKETEIIEFEEKVSPLFHKMNSNTNQIHTLTQLQDTLLPKLMSGEVRVK